MILITGAHGFVGQKLLATLPDAVAAPSLRDASPEDIRQILLESGADTVIHTAAVSDIGACQADRRAPTVRMSFSPSGWLRPVRVKSSSASAPIRFTAEARSWAPTRRTWPPRKIFTPGKSWKWSSGYWRFCPVPSCFGRNGCLIFPPPSPISPSFC